MLVEDGGEVALNLEGGAGGLLEADAELVGDDGGEGGLAEPGGSEEEDVIEGLAAGASGFERDGELLLGALLADELAQPVGAQLELEGGIVVDSARGDEAVGVVGTRAGVLELWFGGVHSGRY